LHSFWTRDRARGTEAESAWKDLLGASPASPAEFVSKLLAKDKGWLAAYFDALSRVISISRCISSNLTACGVFYEAFSRTRPFDDAARAAFRPAPGLLLLVTRLQWEPNGDPYVPGICKYGKKSCARKAIPRLFVNGESAPSHVANPEQLAQGMFAISRAETDEGPLQIYLTLTELDSRRSPEKRLSPQTVLLLADKFAQFSNQYLIFSEFSRIERCIYRSLCEGGRGD